MAYVSVCGVALGQCGGYYQLISAISARSPGERNSFETAGVFFTVKSGNSKQLLNRYYGFRMTVDTLAFCAPKINLPPKSSKYF